MTPSTEVLWTGSNWILIGIIPLFWPESIPNKSIMAHLNSEFHLELETALDLELDPEPCSELDSELYLELDSELDWNCFFSFKLLEFDIFVLTIEYFPSFFLGSFVCPFSMLEFSVLKTFFGNSSGIISSTVSLEYDIF